MAKGSEMQQQLGQANEDVRAANNHIKDSQKENSRVLEEIEEMKAVANDQVIVEIEEMKKAAADANLGPNEALLAQIQVNESCKIEKVCVKDLEQGYVESAEEREEAGQLEIEAVQKQSGLNVEALSFAAKETKRLKQELSLAIKEKNKALREAEDAMIAVEANSKQVEDLSLELSSLKKLLKAANISLTVSEKLRDSNVEMESNQANELLALSSSTIDPQMPKVQKSKNVESELVENASIEKLELELKNAKDRESQAMGFLSESKIRIEVLKVELERAKESEAKMLESLISQTKQFEETKISLEEAKLEIASLYENIGSLRNGSRALDESHQYSKIGELDKTVKMLKNELKFATEAEENSRKAMDGLAFALKEVTTEANQVKEKLASALSELEDVRVEAAYSKQTVKSTDDKFQVLLDEARREIDFYKQAVEILKQETEESTISWNVTEGGLLTYIKKSDAEIASLKEENRKLAGSLKEAKEEIKMAHVEIRNLRDIVKQAVNEATVAKEVAEIARTENSQLKDNLSDVSSALESITKENERLKKKENAALDNFKELMSLNDTTSTTTLSKTGSLPVPKSVDAEPEARRKAKAKENKERKEAIKFSLVRSKEKKFLQLENIHKRHNEASLNSDALEASTIDSLSSPEHSISPLALTDDGETSKWDDLDHNDEGGRIDDFENDGSSLTRPRKKKTLLKQFRTFLRRKSC
eukprot:TRINITY_DN18616_c0_g1_i1.p1 TRINITY_DN18616_c0_g1~~TRINITY_DN18616_c0_g1_i1.p1  ORF type:complete len:709 (-),score=215.93 TRINITY_DN18616_c0_g1_i1:242-2368(-)